MQIKIRHNAYAIYQRQNSSKDGSRYWGNLEWAGKMKMIENMVLDVETDHLFLDQYNTASIPGVSELGLRIHDDFVLYVIDDERIGKMKCKHCGNVEKTHPDFPCKGCGTQHQWDFFKNGYKFTELSNEAKKVAIEGFQDDARDFDFEEKDYTDEQVSELLTKEGDHRFNHEGIVIGKVSTYFNWGMQKQIESFEKGGMY